MRDLPFQKHSSTSRAAAEAMQISAGTLRAEVFMHIKTFGPCSDEQIQESLRMNPSTQRPRRIELLRAGLIEECGETLTHSKRKAKLWRHRKQQDSGL